LKRLNFRATLTNRLSRATLSLVEDYAPTPAARRRFCF
jgi:hypothetical protein